MKEYDKAVRETVDRRRMDLDAAHIKWQEALRADDELYAAFVAYQNEMIEAAKGKPNKLPNARAALSARMRKVGISRADFEPPVHCKLCNDTGYVNGKYCKCVIRRVIAADRDNLTLPSIDFDKAKSGAPEAIAEAYTFAERYIAEYPDNGKPFIALVGRSGTGKTVLASAIATALMAVGASAVTVTAFDFVRRALDYHTQFSITDYVDRFTPMLDCDVLVIDDLGKEPMLKNVTVEYLYAVINQRWLHKKHTIITSNLAPADILSRYGEAVTSRLIDKNVSNNFAVSGNNTRIK